MLSAPAPPSMTLLPSLPVMVLARLLPVPLMLPAPVGQRQVLDIGAERVADRGDDGVGAGVGGFRDHVAGIVDIVGVVAEAAGHAVGTGATVDDVVAFVAGDGVGEAVAGAVDIAGAGGERQVLDIGAERVADRGDDGVGAGVGGFRDHVAGIVDIVGVVAEAAGHAVGTGATVDDVVAFVAGDGVGEAVAGAVDVAGAGRPGSGSRHWRRACS